MDPSHKDWNSERMAVSPQSGATPSPPSIDALPTSAPTAFEGELSFFSLPELVQLVCSSGQDAEIAVTGRVERRNDEAEQRGRVIVRGGRVFRCSAGATSGEAAFFELARLRHGRFSVNPLPSEGKDQASLLRYSWQELLLESARREDEEKRDSAANADAPPPTQRAASANDGYVELFGSTPPPPPHPAPAPRGEIYDRATERGQLIPFPRKLPSEPTLAPPAALHSAPPPSSLLPPRSSATPAPPIAAPRSSATPAPSIAAPRSTPTPTPSSTRTFSSPMERLMQEATGAYLRREYDRALELFERCREIDPADRRVLHNIERLKNRRNRP